MRLTYRFHREGFSIHLSWAHHTLVLAAWWAMGWRTGLWVFRGDTICAGPLQLSLVNEGRSYEMSLALRRKYHGTLEEQIRGTADFTLMSMFSTEEEKEDARAVLARLNNG
jgi:hypothetical protein